MSIEQTSAFLVRKWLLFTLCLLMYVFAFMYIVILAMYIDMLINQSSPQQTWVSLQFYKIIYIYIILVKILFIIRVG